MKRLRNIAVRMRPAAPVDEDDLGPVSAPQPAAQAHLPQRPTSKEAHPVSHPNPKRPQIWDLEDALHDAGLPPASCAAAGTQTGDTLPSARPAASEPSPARAKTRVLGFSAVAATLDPLAGPTAKPTAPSGPLEPRFAAGWLIVVDGPGRGADFGVTTSVSTIGRDSNQAICLDFGDSAISREAHASVVFDQEQHRFFVGHGGKSNIVRRNGNPVLATEELFDGDHLRIGKTTLLFKALCGPGFSWDDDAQAGGTTNE